MSENKFEGRKQYQSNQKHKRRNAPKTNSKPSLPEIPKLEKNWDRYEEDRSSSEDDLPTSKDYKFLSESGVSQGSYFQFKKDKHFLPTDDEKPQVDGMFQLNMHVINMALATIPFYERNKIDKDMFNQNQIATMDENARLSKETFELYLKKQNNPIIEDDVLHEEEASEIEEENITSKAAHTTVKDALVEDLENWLDGILS